jgi:hypothetical protein
MNNYKKLEWIHFAIQEAINGNILELNQSLKYVEDLREEYIKGEKESKLKLEKSVERLKELGYTITKEGE